MLLRRRLTDVIAGRLWLHVRSLDVLLRRLLVHRLLLHVLLRSLVLHFLRRDWLLILADLPVWHLRELQHFAAHQLHGITVELIILRHLVNGFEVVLEVLRLHLQLVDELRSLQALLDVRLANRIATCFESEHLELAMIHFVTRVHKEWLRWIRL